MRTPKSTLYLLKKAIRRGENITFVYRTKEGKESVHNCLPIDIDRRMTLYGICIYSGKEKENCWKINFMNEIKVLRKKEGYIEDQYGKVKSQLIGDRPSYIKREEDSANTLADVAVVKGKFRKDFFR